MRRILACLLLSTLLFSFTASASPSNERYKCGFDDVGWSIDPSADLFTANVAVLNVAITFQTPEAILVPVARYERRRFVSFNAKHNRWRKQFYGRTESEYRSIAKEAEEPPLPDTYNLIKEAVIHPVTEYPAVE
jgi:hypothetical protein